jgi:FtsP/CotA-like multicopper oxidase with cupredoxin domain
MLDSSELMGIDVRRRGAEFRLEGHLLVRTGETVDILLDVTNPGRWMAHCRIAEHHESGMMFGFDIEP